MSKDELALLAALKANKPRVSGASLSESCAVAKKCTGNGELNVSRPAASDIEAAIVRAFHALRGEENPHRPNLGPDISERLQGLASANFVYETLDRLGLRRRKRVPGSKADQKALRSGKSAPQSREDTLSGVPVA